MNRIPFRYGEGEVAVDVSGAASVTFLKEKDAEPIEDLKAAFRKAVKEEAVGMALSAAVCKEDLVTIVISDITRFWMRQDLILKELVSYLNEEIGVADEQIKVLVALGTHRGQTEEELDKIASKEIRQRIQVVSHDAYAEDLVYVGTTKRGTEVRVNPLAVGRKVILIGGTVHHLMSGFGGGRKSVLPGISGKETITHNHLMCLSDKGPHSSELIGLAKLEGNPVHEDMTEAASLVNPAFGINIVSNAHGRHCHLICGHWQKAWEESCRIVHETFGVPITKKADVVIGSCGGYPKDINLYQGVKTLLNMSQAVKEGGTMIFIAECRDGGGTADFFGWNESLKTNSLDADLRADFSIGGYIFYAGCEAIAKGDVHMLTEIPQDVLAAMKINASSNLEELLKQVDFRDKDVYVMQSGGFTVPY